MRLLKDSLTAKTVANELLARSDNIAAKAKAHPDWVSVNDLSPGTLEYMLHAYANVNFNLRNGESLDDKQGKIYNDLMKDMRPLSSPFTAFRVLREPVTYKEGYKFTAKQFWSTTLDYKNLRAKGWMTARCIKFLIIPKGVDAIMTQGYLGESEIILPPGTQFTVRHKATDYYDEISGAHIDIIYVIYVRN